MTPGIDDPGESDSPIVSIQLEQSRLFLIRRVPRDRRFAAGDLRCDHWLTRQSSANILSEPFRCPIPLAELRA